MTAVNDYIRDVVARGDEGSGLLKALTISTADGVENIDVVHGFPPGVRVPEGYRAVAVSLGGNSDELDPMDFGRIGNFIVDHDIGLVVVGPEAPLAEGIVDELGEMADIYGPTKAAAQLEADKFFSQFIMQQAGVAQANGQACYSTGDVLRAIGQFGNANGVVLKAQGLHAGKGVSVYDSIAEAEDGLGEFLAKFGESVLVSERLMPAKGAGEYSILAFCDGEHVIPIPFALKDHKHFNGANSGGMAAYTSPSYVTAEVFARSVGMMEATVAKLAEGGVPYTGFLYGGFMLTEDGERVIEFNCRMGDPETQPAMLKLKGDLYQMIKKSLDGSLTTADVQGDPNVEAALIVLASNGYPGAYAKGVPIHGIDHALARNRTGHDITVFHAGTKYDDSGAIVTTGGRVLGVGARGRNLATALESAYEGAGVILDLTNTVSGTEALIMRKDIRG